MEKKSVSKLEVSTDRDCNTENSPPYRARHPGTQQMHFLQMLQVSSSNDAQHPT